MFASHWGRKMFLCSMGFSWLALLLPYIFLNQTTEAYFLWVHFSPSLIPLMACLIFLCFSKPQRTIWKRSLPIVTEALLISVPAIYFRPILFLLYIYVKSEAVVSLGPGITALNWSLLTLVGIQVFVFPILRRWGGEKLSS